jgi:TfoX/Sxy family transcriptional regulator of competence genes
MAYDEELAGRIRDALAERTDFDEKLMFGGIAFMVNTHLACGVIDDDLLVRVGKENYEDALGRGGQVMDFTGRPMRSIVMVPGGVLGSGTTFVDWIEEAVAYAKAAPPKPSGGSATRKRSRT